MMTIEYCASCGCSEFSHVTVQDCSDDCQRFCDVHVERIECECGACGDYRWIDEPDELVCACGCLESDHDEGDVVAGTLLDEPCGGCGQCLQFVEVGTELERVRAQVEARGSAWPVPAVPGNPPRVSVRVHWFDGPLRVVGALVQGDGGPERVLGLPRDGDAVHLWFAETDDGLEVALTRDDIAG